MKNLIKLITATIFVIFTSNASAILIGTVGSLDTLVADTNLTDTYTNPYTHDTGCNDTCEEEWIEGVLGFDIDYTKYDYQPTWLDVDDGVSSTDYWAFDFFAAAEDGAGLTTGPDYFMVKVGGGNTTDDLWLFENKSSDQYGFIDFGLFGGTFGDVEVVSHFAATGSTSVPEPSILALFGLGLLGMGLTHRRVMKLKK